MFGDLDWPLNASRGLSAIAEFLVTKCGGKVGRWPRKKPLEFGGNPDLDLNAGIFNGIFTAMLWHTARGVYLTNSTTYMRKAGNYRLHSLFASDMIILYTRAALAEVCALRVLLVYICVVQINWEILAEKFQSLKKIRNRNIILRDSRDGGALVTL